MYTLTVKNDKNESLRLTGNKNYTVYKIEGLNPPQATLSQSVNSTMDGSSINNVRVESRNIVIYLAIEGEIEKNRLNLYKYFPVKKTITLYFKNGSRDVYIEGVVELIVCDQFTSRQVAQISIVCPKPYFKAADDIVSAFSNISSFFSFPFAISAAGTEISAVTTNIRKSIINTGDIETGVIIKLFATGTVVNPVIYDVMKRTQIKLNITMQPSDTIIINTKVGEKSIALIRSGITTNALGYMAANSTWFELTSGDNVFAYECESGTSSLQLTFSTAMLYSGV